jgi:hypothetical protein
MQSFQTARRSLGESSALKNKSLAFLPMMRTPNPYAETAPQIKLNYDHKQLKKWGRTMYLCVARILGVHPEGELRGYKLHQTHHSCL